MANGALRESTIRTAADLIAALHKYPASSIVVFRDEAVVVYKHAADLADLKALASIHNHGVYE